MPAEHTLAGVQCAALLPLLNCPVGHAVHTRSTVEEGVFDTKVPAAHAFHGWQESALLSVENCSLAQALQLRSLVVFPSFATKFPGLQVDLSTQTVAGLLS